MTWYYVPPFLVLDGEYTFRGGSSGMKVEERRMEVDVFKWEGGKEMEEGEEWIMKKK